MKRWRISVASVLLLALLSVAACRKQVPEYSAEVTLVPPDQSYSHPFYDHILYRGLTAKVSATPSHVRIDAKDFGFLLDLKTQDNWLLINHRIESIYGPGPQKFAIRSRGVPSNPRALALMVVAAQLAPPRPDKPRPTCGAEAGCKIIGEEEIDGRVAEKWEIRRPGRIEPVYVWIDRALGIVVKSSDGFQVRGIVQEPQDPTLFSPAGYQVSE